MRRGLARGCVALITSRRRLAPDARTERAAWRALDAFLEDAVAAGVDVIQIREPDAEAGLLAATVEAAVRRAQGTAVRVVVNDRVDVAVAGGADGVHLPGRGLPASRARALMPDGLIGASTHKGQDLCDEAALDYVIFGTVFESVSKPGVTTAGVAGLVAEVRRRTVPVLAIGGVTPERARACVEAGAAGVAGIGVFLPPGQAPGAIGVGPAVRAFREALSRIC